MNFDIRVVGPNIAQVFQTVGLKANAALVPAVREELEVILARSLQQVPVATGALAATGRVEGPEWYGTNLRGGVAYGSDAVPYALYVHEDLLAIHPQGKAKYLEDPAREEFESGRSEVRIGNRIRFGGFR